MMCRSLGARASAGPTPCLATDHLDGEDSARTGTPAAPQPGVGPQSVIVMLSRRPRPLLALGALLSLLPVGALAAQSGPETVPTIVVVSALGPLVELFGGAPRFASGRAPEGWPAALVPAAPVRALGGATFPALRSAVFAYPVGQEQALNEYGALVTKAGWRLGSDPGGFAARKSLARTYCGEGAIVTVTPVDTLRDRATLTVVMFAMRPGMFSPACGPGRPAQTNPVGAGIQLPTLRPPAGATGGQGAPSYSPGTSTVSARLTTTLTPAALLAHYAAQLEADGWLLKKPHVDGGLAEQMIERRDASANHWVGTLSTLRVGPGYDVTVRVFKDTP
jgi:hypothetical protein